MHNGHVQGFGFHTLALLTAVGFAGPVLASVPRLRIPVIVGELIAGLVIGKTGFGVVDACRTRPSNCSRTSASRW